MPTTTPRRSRRSPTPTSTAPAPIADPLDTPPVLAGRHAVYLAHVPETFAPTGFRDVPPRIHGATLLAAGLDADLATAFARLYNERMAEPRRDPGPRTWALVVELPDVPDFGTDHHDRHRAHYRGLLAALTDQAAAPNMAGRPQRAE